MVEHH